VPKVLLVEDDPRLAAVLIRVLAEEMYEPAVVASLAQAAAALAVRLPDILLVDRMLPDGDGLDLCATARRHGLPMMMLTALGSLSDRVVGLDAGADDYLIKPFEIDELLARMRALLRRNMAPIRSVGSLRVDLRNRKVWSAGQTVELTAREFEVLAHIVDADGAVVSRARLLASVWGTDHDPGTNLVEVHMSRLRNKLAAAGSVIKTVRGSGYRLEREDLP
jgi:two-component system OmpR family response regulator